MKNLKVKMSLLLVLLAFSAVTQAGDLIVNIQDIRQTQGRLYLELYDKRHYDRDGDPLRLAEFDVTDTAHTYRFENLPQGEYAVMLFQDLNANHEPDFSVFSGPKEPVGTSQNSEFSFGPPAWDKMSFVKQQKDMQVDIVLIHP